MQPATVKAKHVLVKTEQEAKEVIKETESLSGQKLADKFGKRDVYKYGLIVATVFILIFYLKNELLCI